MAEKRVETPQMQGEQERAAAVAQATAEAQAEAAERNVTETIPGGRYVVDGETVDAEGKPA